MATLDLLNLPDATIIANYRADNTINDGANVSEWPDRSGNGYSLTQATSANRPTIVSDGGADFNNKPVLQFDGINDSLGNTTSPVEAQPVTYVAIAKCTLSNTSNKVLIFGDGDSDPFSANLYWNTSEVLSMYAGGTASSATSTSFNVPVLVEATFNGASSSLRMNSVVEDSDNVGSPGIVDGLTIGNAPTASAYFGGYVAEILIVDGTLSEMDRTYLAQYANQRYNIDLPFPQLISTTNTSFSTETTSHAVNMPAITEAGQLLRILFGPRSVSTRDINVPTGWTVLWDADDSSPSTVYNGVSLIKVADGTEGGTTVDIVTDASHIAVAEVRCIGLWYGTLSGVATSFSPNSSTSSSPNPRDVPVSWGALNMLFIAEGVCLDDDATVTAYPTGYIDGNYAISGGGADNGASCYSATFETTNPLFNPPAFTLSESESWLVSSVAIRPISAVAEGGGFGIMAGGL